MADQRVEAGVRHPADHAERQTVHQVVELRPTGQHQRTDLADRLADDRDDQRDDQERADGRRADHEAVDVGQRDGQRHEVGPQHREQRRQQTREAERQRRDGQWLVLPHVHVVEIDDVDDRNRERGDQHRDRQRSEDRRDQRHDHCDAQGDPVRLRLLTRRPPRHDRGDQGERRDRLVGFGREGAPPGLIIRSQVLAAHLAEVGDLGDIRSTTWTLHHKPPGPGNLLVRFAVCHPPVLANRWNRVIIRAG